MEEFAAVHASKSERKSPKFQFEPAQTMSEDEKSILEKGHQHHTLAAPFRGSDEENQADESHSVSKIDGCYTVPYKWDTLLDPFIGPDANAKRPPNNETILSEQISRRNEINPLQEKRSTSSIYTPSPTRSTKPLSRSRKDQRQSQCSTRSVLSKATRDLIFNESTDSADVDEDGPLSRVDSIEEVVPSNAGASQMSRESLDDHDERKPVKSLKLTKTKSKQGSHRFTSLSPAKSQVSHSSSGGRSKAPEAEDQKKTSSDFSEEKNVLAQQNPFTLTNLFTNSCLPSQSARYEKETKNDLLITKPTNSLSFLTEVFQCGNHYGDEDAISPRNTQLVLDAFDRTLCGIPAKMANISLDDLLNDESDDDLDRHRSMSRQTRSRSKKCSTTTPTSMSRVDASSNLYGVLKEHMSNLGANSGDSNSHRMGSSIDNDPQVQRELQRLCKLLEAKLDGQGLEPAYESDVDDYYDSESESDYDDEEDKLFESWVRSGPIMDLFGIGCNANNGNRRREITYDDRITSGRSYHRDNERLYPEEENDYSEGFDEDYYSDAESTESNLTVVAAGDYK